MSESAVLTFLPWLRRGLVRSVAAAADANGVPTATLGTVEAAVTVGAKEIVTQIEIRGPEAVVGLLPGQVLRHDPPADTLDFEANYFPFVELLSPDLPWMFTPAQPKAQRLMPWLVLVVVEERQGVTLAARAGAPLPVLSIDDATRELPPLREAWAWAHVQSTADLSAGVASAFAAQPEAFIARLMCARQLRAETRYVACVVPSFEPGRLAGLGVPVADRTPTLAWSSDTRAIELPVYTSWRFRTARKPGDFESLVKRLTARRLEGSVGVHDLDIGEPGSPRLPTAPGTHIGFRGALVSSALKAPVWPPAHQSKFQSALRTLLNEGLVASAPKPDPGRPYDALLDDPVVAPPAYGAFAANYDQIPAATTVAPARTPSWISEVNLDPAQRSGAGLGAQVVRIHQETLVASAWEQAAALRQVNRVLNRTRLALEVGERFKLRIDAMSDGALLQLTSAVHSQLKSASMSMTLKGRLSQSALPAGLLSAAFRRRLRPGTSMVRATESPAATPVSSAELTRRFVTDPVGSLEFAEFAVPCGTLFTDGQVQEGASLVAAARALDLDTAFGMGTGGAIPRSFPVQVAGRVARRASRTATTQFERPDLMVSPVAVAIDTAGAGALAISDSAALVRDKLDPTALLQVRVRALVTAPESAWTSEPVPAKMHFAPAYADPLYELLVQIDPELLLPGVGEIPKDTVALATMNPAFVEAFLLGANDELRREFMWREVPVELADTWLKTFWAPTAAAATDITAIETWSSGALGSHRPAGAIEPESVLVLLIKGDLLRRYPRTLIYAIPSIWKKNEASGEWERVEDERALPLYPSFVGALGSDVTFLGFQFGEKVDVDTEVAGNTTPNGPNPGWFFVFEQPPTEPRFGLDVGRAEQSGKKPPKWRNVSWFHALSGDAAISHVPLEPLDDGVARPYDDRGENTWTEVWAKDAAGMARITLQRPVRMLVHADQMLQPSSEVEVVVPRRKRGV
jgi:hypothetical protein